jgi:hypothetical protein
MNIKDLIDVIVMSYECKRPVLALGQPGCGKSASFYKAAQLLSSKYETTLEVIEVRGASVNPAETANIKAVIDGKVVELQQSWVPTKERVEAGECAALGLVVVEEMGDALPAVQSAMQELLLDRKLGSARLAEGWHVVAASNRAADKAAAGRLSTAVVNRCITITVEPDPDVFCEWAIDHEVHPSIIAYVRWRGAACFDFDPTRKAANPAFCSPRSLHIMSDVLKVREEPHFETVVGCLGDGVGSEVVGFLSIISDLPDINKLLKQADTYPVPKKPDVAIATMYALIARISTDTIDPILRYITRNQIEYATVAIKDMLRMKKDLVTTHPVFHKWAADERNIRLLM